ncbi:unnamed protein product [Malus baccata var. baccata]
MGSRHFESTEFCGFTQLQSSLLQVISTFIVRCINTWNVVDHNTRRSMTGYLVFLGNNPILWQSKKQSSVSISSTETEYKALAHTTDDLTWIRAVLKDLEIFLPTPPVIRCDNMSTIALSANPVFHSRIKHLDRDYHFVLETVQQGDLEVSYIPTKDQYADILTKGLHGPSFVKHCYNLKLGNPSYD